MPQPLTTPVGDTVPKVNEEVAVGEDLRFQRGWWKFERVVWTVFLLILICDLVGLLGRGPLAHASLKTPDGSMTIRYDRIQRTGTPSMLDVSFSPATIQHGRVELFASESMVKELGTQRVVPNPEVSVIGNQGLTYRFAASGPPAEVQFQLQPDGPGVFHFTLDVPGFAPATMHVVVMP